MTINIQIGTSGWSYKHWTGSFYPPELRQNEWLSWYSKFFSTVEINMTFYRQPSFKAIDSWLRNVQPNFMFSVKAPRTITHIKKLKNCDASLGKFYQTIDPMKDRTCALLFQMPPYFKKNPETLKILDQFLDLCDKSFMHVIEFRDHSWWDDSTVDFIDKRAVFCSVKGLEMPTGMPESGSFHYIRMHGDHYNGLYGKNFLKNLLNEIQKCLVNFSDARVLVYFNNDEAGYAVKDALILKELAANDKNFIPV